MQELYCRFLGCCLLRLCAYFLGSRHHRRHSLSFVVDVSSRYDIFHRPFFACVREKEGMSLQEVLLHPFLKN